jgi:hypothetical protein
MVERHILCVLKDRLNKHVKSILWCHFKKNPWWLGHSFYINIVVIINLLESYTEMAEKWFYTIWSNSLSHYVNEIILWIEWLRLAKSLLKFFWITIVSKY